MTRTRCGSWCALACVLLAVACDDGDGDQPAPVEAQAEPHCLAPIAHPLDDELQLSHLQAKSTHNSYHLEPPGNTLPHWSYSHAPLDVQLGEQGVRHFELDVRINDDSGQFEVFHAPLVDEQSSCRLLSNCLATVRGWSAAHPGHQPIWIHVEPKDALVTDFEGYFDALHREITSQWAERCLVTPDMVRGEHASLAEAVRAEGWPTLAEGRGKLVLVLLDRGAFHEAYSRGGDNIDGRLMFAEGDPGEPYALVMRADDPIGGAAAIAAALAEDMIVRTRADTDSVEALAGDTGRLDAALASGAHFVSTDYPAPVEAHDYWLDIPEGTPSRCNPITAPGTCTSEAIEDPTKLE